jgi:hypothetical protein
MVESGYGSALRCYIKTRLKARLGQRWHVSQATATMAGFSRVRSVTKEAVHLGGDGVGHEGVLWRYLIFS